MRMTFTLLAGGSLAFTLAGCLAPDGVSGPRDRPTWETTQPPTIREHTPDRAVPYVDPCSPFVLRAPDAPAARCPHTRM